MPFDGTGDAMDFINTIEARTGTEFNDYQRILVVEARVLFDPGATHFSISPVFASRLEW